jgi:mRNA interferase RelE/StbE
MDSYSIRLKPSVDKDVRHIPARELGRIFERIEALSENPLPKGVVKLSGAEGLYRIRAGNYRIVYELVALPREVVIHYVRHRRDVYRNL